MTRYYLLFCVFLMLASTGVDAQERSFAGYIKAADQASARDDHYNAYRLYSIAAEDDWNDDKAYDDRIGEVYYKASNAAYRSTAYGEAERYLVMLQSHSSIADYPLAKYYLGQSVFRQGRYDQAVAHFQQFLDEQPRAPEAFRSKALARINDADWAIDALSRASDIKLNHLPEGINTSDSDIMFIRGPENTRYYSSNHFEYKRDSLNPKRTLSRIMMQTGEATAEQVDPLINLPGKSVAHTAFNTKMNQVYYSVCDFRNYDELICDVYRADVSEDGSWSNPVKTDINQTGFSTTQPSVGYDESDGKEYLYFSSDRPGGQGGLDIYRSAIEEDGTTGPVVNLEKINSAGDEASPFWYGPRKTLYFATDGRFSFGGLDVYKSFLIDGAFRRPINMGAPVNSAADEAYYTRFDDPNQAYVSSRRPGAEAIYYSDAKDVCCYDIYEFTPDPRIDLQAITLNKLTGDDLVGVTVKLCKITPNGPELVEEVTNLEDNEFNFKVEPGAKYQLKAEKDGFTKVLDEFDLSSPELIDLPFIERRLLLNPMVKLDVYTYNMADEKELPGATIKLFEVTDNGELKLIEEITPNGNDAHFELEIGKNYRVEGAKSEFGKATADVDLKDYDANNGGTTLRRDLYLGQSLEVYVIDGRTDEPIVGANLTLSKGGKMISEKNNPDGNDYYYTVSLDQPFILNTRRAGYFPRTDTLTFTRQDLVDGGGKLVYYVPLYNNDLPSYLPFEVYFDNDHPDPNSYTSRTQLDYYETYQPYVDRREAFKQESSEGLDNEAGFLVRGDIDQFFDQEVEAGWEQLRRFSEALILYMRSGKSFTVELQGYASPRAPTEYNRRLSARRNMSLKNFFRTYKNGALAQFIDNRQLTFTEAALGETTAKLDQIYERLDRERESIYSTVASLERRVVLRSGLSSRKK